MHSKNPPIIHQQVAPEHTNLQDEQVCAKVAHLRQLITEEDDAGRLRRSIDAAAHGKADIRNGQRTRIIHPITNHGNSPPGRLDLAHQRRLATWRHLRVHVRGWNAHRSRDRLGRLPAVAWCARTHIKPRVTTTKRKTHMRRSMSHKYRDLSILLITPPPAFKHRS